MSGSRNHAISIGHRRRELPAKGGLVLLAGFFLGFFVGFSALAATSSTSSPSTSGQSSTSASNVEKTVRAPRAGGDLSATYSGSALETADEDRVSGVDLEFAPWIALGKNYKADAYLLISRDMNGYEETRVGDARLGLLHNPIPLSRVFKTRPKLTLLLPVDSEKREIHSFVGALSAANRFLFQRGMLSGFYQIGLTKNVYSYTTTGLGESNPSWSLGNVLKLVLSRGKFYLDLTGSLTQRWTFENAPSSRFEVGEEIGMSIGAWNIGVGHSNSESLYQANGVDSNFSFANGTTSKYYATLTYSF